MVIAKRLLNQRIQISAMVVNLRLLQLDDASQILLDGNTIDFHQKVKNLGLIINNKLTWDDQTSKICRNVLITLKRRCHKSHHQNKLVRNWVTLLIVLQYLYCDVIFSKSSARLWKRLKVTFNSWTRYVFGYEHIIDLHQQNLG
jgi:hypothetical protein